MGPATMPVMSIVGVLSKRFLTGKKRNGFLSFISAISLFGVVVGVTALVVVMGVMEGFETTLQSAITGTHSHLVLFSRKMLITDSYAIQQRVKEIVPNQIKAIAPYVFSEIMLAYNGRVIGSLLEGVEEASISQATDLKTHLVQGEFPSLGFRDQNGALLREPGIVLGTAVAEKLGASVGDVVTVISPFFDEGNMQPLSQKFRVSGFNSTGMYEYDSKYSYVQASEARSFFKMSENSANAFKVKTEDANNSYLVARKIEDALGFPYQTRDWTELNRNLLYAIKLQKAIIFIVLTSIIVVAAFNIMSTLVMMMNEKKREMSILKAMGLKNRQAAGVFVLVGGIIGATGAICGAALGILIGQILKHTKLIDLPPDIYFFSYLPVDMQPTTLLIIMALSLLIAILATIYPSWMVMRESPVEGLRYE